MRKTIFGIPVISVYRVRMDTKNRVLEISTARVTCLTPVTLPFAMATVPPAAHCLWLAKVMEGALA